MTAKTYAVHYGNKHISRCKTLDEDFASLSAAKAAAEPLANEYTIVLIADTDGNEWDITGAAHGRFD